MNPPNFAGRDSHTGSDKCGEAEAETPRVAFSFQWLAPLPATHPPNSLYRLAVRRQAKPIDRLVFYRVFLSNAYRAPGHSRRDAFGGGHRVFLGPEWTPVDSSETRPDLPVCSLAIKYFTENGRFLRPVHA